jgi:hypothetical protein
MFMNHFHRYRNSFILLLLVTVLFPADLLSQDAEYPFNPNFLPAIFDGKFSDTIVISLPKDTFLKEDAISKALKIPVSLFTPKEEYINRLRKRVAHDFVMNNIRLVKYSLVDFPDEVEKLEEIKPNIFQSLFSVEAEIGSNDIDKSARFIPKRKYWVMNGSSLMQFSQNHISKNWFNGGIGNLNFTNVQSFTANYKKKNVQFNNFIEWKLSFYTNPKDTLRTFRLGEDQIRTYSDFGLKAFNDKWSYSTNLEIKTKLMRNYKENSTDYLSSFLSPLQINLGILGMKYQQKKTSKQNKYKTHDVSIDFSPLSVQYAWVADKNVDPTRYGIKEGDKFLLDLGSTLNAKVIINFNRQVTFTSRFKYFTNYEKSIFESENELNMSLNRFFSTRIYLYGRFDDSKGVKKDRDLGYVQFNELLSFGFNYKW